MPTWKKIVVDGSAISQLTNDANYLADGGTFSASVDSRLDVSETLSASAHTQREAIAGNATTANNSLSSSISPALRTEYVAGDTALSASSAAALRTEYVAGDSALSASAHTQRAAIDAKVSALDSTYATDASVNTLSGAADVRRNELNAALSASTHTQREAIKGLATAANNSLSSSAATAIRAEYVAGDAALSASAHSDRVAKVSVLSASAHAARAGGATSASAHTQRIAVTNNLSSSAATAIRAEYVAGDTALSGAAHIQREAIKEIANAANNSVSSSAAAALRTEYVAGDSALSASTAPALRTEYVAADAALSASQNTYINAKIAGIVNSAPATLDTLDELAAALNDDPNFSASIATSIGNKLGAAYSSSAAGAIRTEYVAGDAALSASTHTQREAIKGLATAANNSLSSSAATAIRTEYKAGDTALSSSAHTQREAIKGLATSANNSLSSSKATALRAEYVAGDSALSASAHSDRVAKVAVLSASAHTARATGATSGSSHAQRVALIATLSASAATANDSSAITVRNLVGQAVVATSFQGDGSNLSNITVDQNATVASTFTNQTTVATDHNFGTKNVMVQVYDNNDQVIIPATITSTNTNRSTVTFDTSTTGTIVIARGGHIVSGSVNSFGGQAPAFYAASASTHADRVAKISVLSASAHTQREAVKGLATTANNTLSSSAATALRAEYVAADSALSASQNTYINAKVAGLVDSSPATLDTLNELAAALGDDATFSASIATSIGNRQTTAAQATYSGSSAGALRTEYKAGDTALSGAAHTQREAIKGLATTANNSLSGSSAGALRTEYKAGDAAISGALNTRIVALEGAGTTAALSASAHTQREAIKGLATAANTSLSSSKATAIRAEYVAGDAALSASAHTQREAVKGLATSANNSLSSSKSTALRAEYKAADTALSASQNTYINAKIAGIVNSAPATLDTLDELAAALNDDPNFSASIATSIGNRQTTAAQATYSSSVAAALRAEHVAKDGVLSGSAHTQREAIKGLATAANNSLSSSAAGALRTEYKAGDTALSSSLNTRLVELEAGGGTAALSASAHTQREVIKGLATTANNSLSSSKSIALRSEYVAGDSALSASAHTQREAIKGLATSANTSLSSSVDTHLDALIAAEAASRTSLSGSSAAALRAEYVAADTALSASQNTYINAKVAGITSDFTISDGSDTDSFTTGQTLTFAGTANEIETTVTNNQVQIGIPSNPTLTGDVTITGDLTITGDTIEQQVTNLNVEDKFILINSGSASGDSGIIFGGSGGVSGTGTSLFFDDSEDVLALGAGVAFGATTATTTAKIGAITTSTAVPTATPTFQGIGAMHVKTDSQDIYIYTAD
jgi:hypothetical protein